MIEVKEIVTTRTYTLEDIMAALSISPTDHVTLQSDMDGKRTYRWSPTRSQEVMVVVSRKPYKESNG